MKNKPWSLVLFGWLHILAPLGNLLMNASLNNRSLGAQLDYWINVLPLPFVLVYTVIPFLAGIFILICRKWSYYLYLYCLSLIVLSNIYSLITRHDWIYFVGITLFILIDILLAAYFVVPTIQKIYFDRRVRWWESARRYHVNLNCKVNESVATIKNIAMGGALVADLEAEPNEGDLVSLTIAKDDLNLSFQGKIVYKNGAANKYGIKYEALSREQETALKKYIEKLESDGQVIKERLPDENDSFVAWIKRLVTTGKGMMPENK